MVARRWRLWLQIVLALLASSPFGHAAQERTEHAGVRAVELRGRALDENGRPLSDQELSVELSPTYDVQSIHGLNRFGTRTDGAGQFVASIPTEFNTESARWVFVRVASSESEQFPERIPRSRTPVPVLEAKQDLDLGDVRLVAPTSTTRFLGWSDDQLIGAIREWRDSDIHDLDRYFQGLLCEVVRRDSAALQAALLREYERPLPDPTPQSWDSTRFEVLVALRRAQHQPDPLAVELVGDAVISSLPDDSLRMPTVLVRLRNADKEGESVRLLPYPWQWQLEVRSLDGSLLPRIKIGHGYTAGISPFVLEPGATYPYEELVIADVSMPSLGTYEMRVAYHDRDDIAGVSDPTNLIVSCSPWQRIKVREGRLEYTSSSRPTALGYLKSHFVAATIAVMTILTAVAFLVARSRRRRT
jgi:hypothetical protein